ncbi:hypothetical protein PG990_013201 [Apiospora arundinis]|uniref:GroES-like protein n=1 Tax=Apiospora arundinis TaxID=335852 RepID=A0ABR2HU22_9PEZI
MENNQAALILAADNSPLQVGPGPDQSSPAADEVVIKVAAVAINPSEWKMKEYGYLPLKYPHVLGSDVAGTVVKVGEEVKRFKPGDRVLGHCLGLVYGGAKHGGFQNFTTLREVVTAPIPDGVRFEDAAVLPLGISTAAAGLFDDLKLRLPSVDGINDDSDRNEVVLIWGAASSMGSIAVQLAVAAGYHVITTASKKNHDYARALVPNDRHITVFDYQGPNVAGAIIDHINQKRLKFVAAFDCIGLEESTLACAKVAHEFGGGLVPTVLWPPAAESLPADVEARIVNGGSPGLVAGSRSAVVWQEYVPAALKEGALRMRPEPEIVGTGLDKIEGALNLHKAGVLPTNTTFWRWDVNDPVPDDLLGSFGIINVRFMVLVVRKDNVPATVSKLIQLLSCLQWIEPDNQTVHGEVTKPGNKKESIEELMRLLQSQDPRLNPTWVPDLPGIFKGCGLVDVDADIHITPPRWAYREHECGLVMYELIARKTQNAHMAAELKRLIPLAMEDTRKGAYLATTKYAVVGRRP